MKFHNLHITTKTFETYQKITKLLKVKPKKEKANYSLWTYQVVTNEEDKYFDYINNFLDLLEPNFKDLKALGIKKDDIIIWLFYEFKIVSHKVCK